MDCDLQKYSLQASCIYIHLFTYLFTLGCVYIEYDGIHAKKHLHCPIY